MRFPLTFRLFILAIVSASLACLLASPAVAEAEVQTVETELLVVGATESGWAAAIQAARMGVGSITIVHDGKWIGGQFTEQALACVDENKGVGKVGWGADWHPMKRSFHRSGLFKEWMDRMESFNAKKYGDVMPGRPYHGPSTFRPAEAEAIFRDMLQPYLTSGQIQLWIDRYPVQAEIKTSGEMPQLASIRFADIHGKSADLIVRAKLTIDASDWGDAIQISGAAYECGPDPRSRYGEPSAPIDLSDSPPNEMNPITWAMVVEQKANALPINIPDRFDHRNFVRSSLISLDAMRDLQWDRPVSLSSIQHWPDGGAESPRQLSVFTVRRLVDGATSHEGQTVILLNYMLGQDYPLERLPAAVTQALERDEPGASAKNIVRMTRRQRQIVFADAKRHSLSLLYHLQNFVHERARDKTNSFRGFELSNEFGTPDRLPPKPYIRESLRLKAMYMMREQDGRNADGETKDAARERFSRVMYPDGVLCWQFHYDFHRTGRAYLKDVGMTGPWIDFEKSGRHTHHVSDRSVFPLRSLIPEQMNGLLGAQKNLGYSSIVCAAIRLHDQCVAIGQAAGATAAVALHHGIQPRQIPYQREQLEEIRDGLCHATADQAALLLWPYRDLAADHPAFVAINRLAAMGIEASESEEVDFRPDDLASAAWKTAMLNKAMDQVDGALEPIGETELTRSAFCQRLWDQVRGMPLLGFERATVDDADADGIQDREDPTLFSPDGPVVWRVRPADPLGADEDGVPVDEADNREILRFNFGPKGTAEIESFRLDFGDPFSDERGYGWQVANGQNARVRGIHSGQARDTFAFTRDAATWECALPNGPCRVTVCVGDAGHEQPGQKVTIEGVTAIQNMETARGRFLEVRVDATVSDGRLTIELGPQDPGCNTCLNWVQISR